MMRILYNRAFGSALGDNAWYICVEVFWGTLFGGVLSFVGAYAIRLGATNQEVTLLSALPALTAAILFLPAGYFLQKRRKPKRWILSGLMLFRVGTLLFVLLPWIHIPGLQQGTLFVIVYTVLTFPMHFFNLGFIPLLADAVPEAQRADAFTARNVVQGAAMAGSTLLLGLWLGRMPYPANYQLMFGFGFILALISLYYLSKIKVPDAKPVPPRAVAGKPTARALPLADLLIAPFKVQGFARIVVNTFIFSVGLWAAGPIMLLYPVRTLGASEAWLGLYAAIANTAVIIGNLVWRRVIARRGEPRVLRFVVLAMGFYPLLVGATPSLTLILVLVGINGLMSGGFNLSHFNIFLKVIPEDQRHNYTALYLTLANVGAFVAPLVAVGLGEQIGFGPVLIICGVLSVVASLSFWVWPVGEAHWTERPPVLAEEGKS